MLLMMSSPAPLEITLATVTPGFSDETLRPESENKPCSCQANLCQHLHLPPRIGFQKAEAASDNNRVPCSSAELMITHTQFQNSSDLVQVVMPPP